MWHILTTSVNSSHWSSLSRYHHRSRLAGYNKLSYEPLTKSMWEGKFRHPVAPKPFNRCRWNYNYFQHVTTHANPCGDAATWAVWANSQFATVGCLSVIFYMQFAHRSHHLTDFDDLYVGDVFWRLGVSLISFRGWGLIPQKYVPFKGGLNRHFSAKPTKNKIYMLPLQLYKTSWWNFVRWYSAAVW